MRKRASSGLSLVEVMIAAGLLAAMILPLLWFAQRSTQGTYASGQHLAASQAAASLMDHLLGLPFDRCRQEVQARSGPTALVADPFFREALEGLVPAEPRAGFTAEFTRAWKSLQIQVEPKEEQEHVFLICLQITWLNQEGNEASRQTLRLEALKFRSTHEL